MMKTLEPSSGDFVSSRKPIGSVVGRLRDGYNLVRIAGCALPYPFQRVAKGCIRWVCPLIECDVLSDPDKHVGFELFWKTGSH